MTVPTAAGEGTGDGPGGEEHIKALGGSSSLTENLGKGIQEDTTPLSTSGLALKSRLDPKTRQLTNILLRTNFTRYHALSKDKGLEEDVLVSNLAHGDMAQNEELSINRPFGTFQDGLGIAPSSSEEHITSGESSSSNESLTPAVQGKVIQPADLDLAQPNFKVLAPENAAPAQSNFAPLVALPSVAPAEPNVGPVVALFTVAPAQINAVHIVDPSGALLVQPNVDVNVVAPGLTFAQPSVALIVDAPPAVAPAQPYVAPNVAPSTGTIIAPPSIARVQLSGAAVAAPCVAPLALAPVGQNPAVNVARPAVAPAQRNVTAVVAHRAPAPAPAQPNAAAVVAPPGAPPAPPNVIDINGGLTRSRLRPLRTSECGGEGNLWPKLRRK